MAPATVGVVAVVCVTVVRDAAVIAAMAVMTATVIVTAMLAEAVARDVVIVVVDVPMDAATPTTPAMVAVAAMVADTMVAGATVDMHRWMHHLQFQPLQKLQKQLLKALRLPTMPLLFAAKRTEN